MPKKSTKQSKSKRKFNRGLLLSFAVLLLISGGAYGLAYWWKEYRNDPVATFYGTINNSLRTSSVKRSVTQESLGQTLDQRNEVTFNPTHSAHGFTSIDQPQQNTSIKTESITTPEEEYVRYIAINTEAEASDFKNLLGVWAKTPSSGGEGSLGDLYGDAVLGVVPFANLPAHERLPLLDFIRDNEVYVFEKDQIQKQIIDGRPVYTYEVTIAPVPYVSMLKEFGDVYGLDQFDDLRPEDYENTQAATVKLSVDVWSREIIAINYHDGSRSEVISGHGSFVRPNLPEDYISVQELQERLQQVQE